MVDDTFDYAIYVYADKGPAELVTTGTATVGLLEAIEDPTDPSLAAHAGMYADTFESIVDTWLTEIGYCSHEAGDEIAKIAFDAEGCKEVFVEITNLTGTMIVTPIFRTY